MGPRIGWVSREWRGSATPPSSPSGVRPTSAGSSSPRSAWRWSACGRRASRRSTPTSSRRSTTSPSARRPRQGRVRARLDLGARGRRARAARVPTGRRGVARRARGRLAWGVAELLNEILPAHTIQGMHVNVRIGDGPVFPTANVAVDHRARRRARAVRGAPAPAHPLPAHPAGRGRGDVPRRRVPVRRARRAPARDRRRRRGPRGLRLPRRAARPSTRYARARRPRLRRRRHADARRTARHARR